MNEPPSPVAATCGTTWAGGSARQFDGDVCGCDGLLCLFGRTWAAGAGGARVGLNGRTRQRTHPLGHIVGLCSALGVEDNGLPVVYSVGGARRGDDDGALLQRRHRVADFVEPLVGGGIVKVDGGTGQHTRHKSAHRSKRILLGVEVVSAPIVGRVPPLTVAHRPSARGLSAPGVLSIRRRLGHRRKGDGWVHCRNDGREHLLPLALLHIQRDIGRLGRCGTGRRRCGRSAGDTVCGSSVGCLAAIGGDPAPVGVRDGHGLVLVGPSDHGTCPRRIDGIPGSGRRHRRRLPVHKAHGPAVCVKKVGHDPLIGRDGRGTCRGLGNGPRKRPVRIEQGRRGVVVGHLHTVALHPGHMLLACQRRGTLLGARPRVSLALLAASHKGLDGPRRAEPDHEQPGHRYAQQHDDPHGAPGQRYKEPRQAVAHVAAPVSQNKRIEEERGVGLGIRGGDADQPHDGKGDQPQADGDPAGFDMGDMDEEREGPQQKAHREQKRTDAQQGMEAVAHRLGQDTRGGGKHRDQERHTYHRDNDAGDVMTRPVVHKGRAHGTLPGTSRHGGVGRRHRWDARGPRARRAGLRSRSGGRRFGSPHRGRPLRRRGSLGSHRTSGALFALLCVWGTFGLGHGLA